MCSLLVRRAAEGFTPLTTALQLGLYRDGTHLGLTNPREIELRRRFWSYTLYAGSLIPSKIKL